MESARRNFFNGVDNSARKMYLFRWKRILASKKNGGLGVSSFFALNRTLLFKWIWRFISNGSSLWSHFIKANYGARGAIDNTHTFPRSNEDATSFWDDVWLANSSLKKLFPRLYSLELDKQCSVAVKVKDSSFISSFGRIPRGDSSGDFSVKSAYRFIDDSFLPKVGMAKAPETDEENQNPNRLGWVRGRVGSTAVESIAHLLFSCHLARQLMRKVARWWEVEFHEFQSYSDWLTWFSNICFSKWLKDVLEGVCYVMWWFIWKFHNF
uniref:RNA-directed DNA polymerase, eukaryota n=1 Tax=Tanacetum cinerariifolium TaxID=118510 RepID=A0A6L2N0S6_TANCI|nr:RNA-directed DNA polymerase, eukaryota [Tanacetum cinerariifolium]